MNRKRNGEGRQYFRNGLIVFEGEFLNGKKWNGKVKEFTYNGSVRFEGEFLNGERNGKGKE